jgi:hypothetical protein
MAQQQSSALDSFMQFYAAPKNSESPPRSALRHSSYNIAPLADEFHRSPGMQSAASSPNPGSPGTPRTPGTPKSLRVSLQLENYSSPITISPRSSPYDSPTTPLPLKKSISTPQIPASKSYNGRESSDSNISAFSNLSKSDSESTPGLERSNSFVILSGDDFPQEVSLFNIIINFILPCFSPYMILQPKMHPTYDSSIRIHND